MLYLRKRFTDVLLKIEEGYKIIHSNSVIFIEFLEEELTE